ncbi:MAG: hypothetical protein IJT88_01635 [Kiritimatiellae bacterium]|nr:hypothetical protein [Kiritimatiellia bacterium]
MIALKDDPIWAAISRFGTPWSPFDFGNGMDVQDVDWNEAAELGVLKEDDPPPKMEPKDFNAGLAAEVEFDEGSKEWKRSIDCSGMFLPTGVSFLVYCVPPSWRVSEKVSLIFPSPKLCYLLRFHLLSKIRDN